MNGQKTNSSRPYWGWFNRELKLLLAFFGLISFSNLVFSNNTFALFTPTLSDSVDNAAVSVNGNQVINSTNKTMEIPLNLTVNTNNKTGYTAILNSETNKTALVNNDSNTAKLTGYYEMFKNRKKLRGGAGSYLSDPSTADKSWLRIDGPTNGHPGYFTRKP